MIFFLSRSLQRIQRIFQIINIEFKNQKLQSQIRVSTKHLALSDKGVLAAGSFIQNMQKNYLFGELKTHYLSFKASSMICDVDLIKDEDYCTFNSQQQPERLETFYDFNQRCLQSSKYKRPSQSIPAEKTKRKKSQQDWE